MNEQLIQILADMLKARGQKVGTRTAIIEMREALWLAECRAGHPWGLSKVDTYPSSQVEARRQMNPNLTR